MSQFFYKLHWKETGKSFFESFPILNYSGKCYCEFSRFSDFYNAEKVQQIWHLMSVVVLNMSQFSIAYI